MNALIAEIRTHFDRLKDQLQCLERFGFQGEGWFKVELLTLFTRLEAEGKLSKVSREVRPERTDGTSARARVDITLEMGGQRYWVELKQWLVGEQAKDVYGPAFYFGDPTGVGILKDVEKLAAVTTDQRWLVVLLAKNPGPEAWNTGLERFHTKFPAFRLTSLTKPEDYPAHYFLGVMHVQAAPAAEL